MVDVLYSFGLIVQPECPELQPNFTEFWFLYCKLKSVYLCKESISTMPDDHIRPKSVTFRSKPTESAAVDHGAVPADLALLPRLDPDHGHAHPRVGEVVEESRLVLQDRSGDVKIPPHGKWNK